MFVGTKSKFDMAMYKQKLKDSSCVCRALYSILGVSQEWVQPIGVGWNTSIWLDCRLYLQMQIQDRGGHRRPFRSQCPSVFF